MAQRTGSVYSAVAAIAAAFAFASVATAADYRAYLGGDFGEYVRDKKKGEELGLRPGVVLERTNAGLAAEYLPPEIVEAFRSGRFRNRIAEWPLGLYNVSDEFVERTKSNAERLDADEDGDLVDKKTGKYPEWVYGLPFPNIDPNDPRAAVKIIWNTHYAGFAAQADLQAYVDLVFLEPGGVQRVLRNRTYYKYWDGQRKYWLDQKKPNPLDLLVQTPRFDGERRAARVPNDCENGPL